MYMDEFKNGANTLNVGTSAEDLLLELDASCEPAEIGRASCRERV